MIKKITPPVTSVYQMLTNHARKFGNQSALISINVDTSERNELTYCKLFEIVIQTTRFLNSQGIGRNDRFAILMHNTPEIVILELAAGIIGATCVPLDTKRDTKERKIYKLKDTKAKLLLVKDEIENSELSELTQISKVVPLKSLRHFFQLIGVFSTAAIPVSQISDLDSIYLILYTSGTTALPKGVVLTARSLVYNADGVARWQKLTPDDRFNIVLPLHHINSTTMSLATLLVGGCVVLNSRYSVSRFWDTITREKCTVTSVVPTILHDLLSRYESHPQKVKVPFLKRILVGSAPVLPEETLKFYKTFGVRVIQGYGQTETALRVTGVPIDLIEKEYIAIVKKNSIGTELTNCKVTIVKKDETHAKEKEEGEICIRGPILAEKYLNNPQETQKAFRHGWFHSGDLGYYEFGDNQKYFYIIGRLKEIIIKGGVNLSPALIEDSLLKNFSEINEVSVVGYPDPRMGEEIAAVIVPKNKIAKRLIDHILEIASLNKISGLSPYEVPKKVFVVDSLPKTSTGKIQRVEVKKMVAEKINLEAPSRFYVRQIKSNEQAILKKVIVINNDRWKGLPATLKEFIARAQNGLLFGVFNQKNNLYGSLSCVRLSLNKVNKLKTWNEATDNGTLTNHEPRGNTLLCVAISVTLLFEPEQPQSRRPNALLKKEGRDINVATLHQFKNLSKRKLSLLAKQYIKEYVDSDKDHVLNFHRKPKGGLPGAKVWKILENGRPDDREACGYNVLMKYPEISRLTKIIHSTSSVPSVMLIEHVLLYAKEHGIKNIIAFSRPVGLRQFLNTKI